MMKLGFLAFLIFISLLQAISTSDFNSSSISEDRTPKQECFNGTFHQNIKDTIRLSKKDEEKKTEEEYGISDATREVQRGKTAGVYGGANINRRPRSHNSAASLSLGLHFWISTLSISANMAFIFIFPI